MATTPTNIRASRKLSALRSCANSKSSRRNELVQLVLRSSFRTSCQQHYELVLLVRPADPDADAAVDTDAAHTEEEDEADTVLSLGLSPVQLSLPGDTDADADIGADVKAELDRANAIPDSIDSQSNEAIAAEAEDDPIENEYQQRQETV